MMPAAPLDFERRGFACGKSRLQYSSDRIGPVRFRHSLPGAGAGEARIVERFSDFYRAATRLTLDMACNIARQLARPDRDWLAP